MPKTLFFWRFSGWILAKLALIWSKRRLRHDRLPFFTHCCGHIVADTNVSPFARPRNICCGHRFCVRDTKSVSDFVQKHFVFATNVSQFAQPKKHHGQQCGVRNNVSSFTRAFSYLRSDIINAVLLLAMLLAIYSVVDSE